MHVMEIIVGAGNLICSYFVVKTQLREQSFKTQQEVELRQLLNEKDDLREARRKLWIVSIGLFISSIFRAARALIGQFLIKNSKYYVCRQGMYFVALNEVTQLFIWYRFIVNFLPTILLFYVIYYIPNRSGQISHINEHKEGVKFNDINIEEAMRGDKDEITQDTITQDFLHDSAGARHTMYQPNKNIRTTQTLENFLMDSYSPQKKRTVLIKRIKLDDDEILGNSNPEKDISIN